MVIRVEQGKGGKDRLSPQLLRILGTYWRLTRPKRWLFPGRDDERPLVPNVLHAACRSACAVGQFAAIQGGAQSLGVELTPVPARDPAELERSMAAFARSTNGGMIVTAGGT